MITEIMDKKLCLTENNNKIIVSLGIALPPSHARARGAHEITVKDAIESVLNQTFDTNLIEIIIIDDGSCDRALSIIDNVVSKGNITVKRYSTDGDSIALARQTIVDKSSGRYIVFIDADMIIPHDFIQKQVDLMNKNPLIGVVGATMRCRSEKSIVAKLEALAQSYSYQFGVLKKWKQNPKKIGTGGSIFRREAIKKAGGFDIEIRGAGEDIDLTARIKSAGYLLHISQTEFEHEFKQTLKSLWNQYVWYGYGSHYCYHKHKDLTDLVYTYFAPISFVGGVIRSILSFKATRQKISFLLPFYNLFKATAWCFGFFKANLEGYEPVTCEFKMNNDD
jgi:cellulose synthase/poly-beta-1,6-N-acetylglucosamine synthase-like glycosyltransferase